MKAYESIHLVSCEDLNHHETLFAARGAQWLVEAGFVAAASAQGSTEGLVMRCLMEMNFKRPVKKGTLLRFESTVVFAGKSSLIVAIVAKDNLTEEEAITGFISFVTIDRETKKKREHGIVLDEPNTPEEAMLRENAQNLYQLFTQKR